jgi:RNA polymerase sigma factor (sigma-70 family)
MNLTREEQYKVEKNLGLVGKVIKDKVHDTNQCGIYTYDDLYQIGCIGLCKAAATDKGGTFSTYAYRLIWNEICDALIYANRRKETEIAVDYDTLAYRAGNEPDGSGLLWDMLYSADSILYPELKVTIEEAKKNAAPTVQKGIDALLLMADGYSCREIGERYGVEPNVVTAWVSKARKYLVTRLASPEGGVL